MVAFCSLAPVGLGCHTPAPRQQVRRQTEQCAERPPPLPRLQQLTKLSQVTREARANLMTRLSHPIAGTVTAVLHHSRLALLEALLAEPKRARAGDVKWFRHHLMVPYVELRADKPLNVLQEGLSGLSLVDQDGQGYALLYMTVRRSSTAIEYRIYFDGPLSRRSSSDLIRVELRFPSVGIDSPWRLRWAISQRNLDQLDRQYMLHDLAPLRELILARREAIVGDEAAAVARAAKIARCAQGGPLAMGLLRPLTGLESQPTQRAATQRVAISAASRPTKMVQQAALRAALLARTTASVRRRLLSGRLHAEAATALEGAIKAVDAVDEGTAERALVVFDRRFAQLLQHGLLALNPGPDGPTPGAVVQIDGAGLSPKQVDQALRRRVAHALRQLQPRWVHAGALWKPSHPAIRPEEFAAVLRATPPGARSHEQVVAWLGSLLGVGWWHPGLPPAEYHVGLVDRSGTLWAAEVARAKDDEALKRLARGVLRNEAFGPDARASELAARELVQRDGPAVIPGLVRVDQQPRRYPRASWIRASASLRDPRIDALIARSLASKRSELRAAALHALGARRSSGARARLIVGLDDKTLAVAGAALQALFELYPLQAARRALLWLEAGAERRAEALGVIGRTPRLAAAAQRVLRPPLVRLLRDDPTPRLVRATAKVMDLTAARWSLALFQGHQRVRMALVESVGRASAGALALLAVALEPGQPSSLRRVAAERMARIATRRQMGPLGDLADDPDPVVRTAALSGLARLKDTQSLLGLGTAARHGCASRRVALPQLCRTLDPQSRRRLLAESLRAYCPGLGPEMWELVSQHQPRDATLLRLGLGHRSRLVRVQAAALVLSR